MKRSLSTALFAAGASACLVAPLAVSAGTAAASSGGADLFRPAPHGAGPATTSGQSENWSGYVRTGSAGSFSSSTASWTVPAVSTAHNGYSSTWVGIDGDTDKYLIQTGTESDVVDGTAQYYAWWEVITPKDEAPETRYSTTIRPGDSISASVTKGTGGDWVMQLTDHTSGVTVSHTKAYAGPGESAEWIEEDTDVDGIISPAPDWHSVVFHGITTNGADPQLSKGEKLVIVDDLGDQEDSTSAPNSTDNGFTVTWDQSGVGSPT